MNFDPRDEARNEEEKAETEKLIAMLLEYSNKLRRAVNTAYPEFSDDVTDNIIAGLVYLDCARWNLQNDHKCRVVPYSVTNSK